MKNTASSNRGAKRRLRLLFIIFTLVFVWGGYQVIGQHQLLADKKAELKKLQTEQAALKKEHEKLALEAKRLKDDDYIAQLARKYYYMSKPGEYLFITPKDKQ